MDQHGRLHMPGFVGQTFEETGVKKEVERAEMHGAIEDGVNRKARRRAEALLRQQDRRQAAKIGR